MLMIHGLGTVNCGEPFVVEHVEDPRFQLRELCVEVLRPEKHNPYANIICYYYFDKKLKSKVEVTLCKDLRTNTFGSEVYFFKGVKETQHYYSKYYRDVREVPNKYRDIIEKLFVAYNRIF